MGTPSPKADPRRRPFGMLDAMILVAALAGALGLFRAGDVATSWDALVAAWGGIFKDSARMRAYLIAFWLAVAWVVLGVPLTAATAAIRLRGPRPGWRRLARRPGAAATLAVVVAWAFAGPFTAAHGATAIKFHDVGDALDAFAIYACSLGGLAVAVSWMVLALAGRWRPERSWVDRLGRAVGAGWIAFAPVGWFVIVMETT